MSFEAIICKNPPEVGVIGEEDSEHVKDFPFVPIGSFEDLADRIDWGQFVGVGFDSNARIEAKRHQIVNQLKKKS